MKSKRSPATDSSKQSMNDQRECCDDHYTLPPDGTASKTLIGETMTREELSEMHWATLKKMVEDAGGEYENKEKSIAFLMGATPVIPTVKLDAPEPVANKKSAITLDRSKPFGEIFGDVEDHPTARYAQGEYLFNSQGEKL